MYITIVGLANVGKTTIVKRVFQGIALDDLGEIKPTVLKENYVFEPNWLGDTVQILDLGGQVSFLQKHLDKKNFEHRDLIIFVVDIQNTGQLEQTKEYFTHIIDILKTLQTTPAVLVLLHKIDSTLRSTLDQNIQQYTQACDTALNGLEFSIFQTSIYDNSVYEAILSMIMKVAHMLVVNFGLRLVSTSTWSISDTSTRREIEEYLYQLGKQQGSDVVRTWIEMIVLQKSLDVLPGDLMSSVDTLDEKQIQIEIDTDTIPSFTTCSSATCLEIFLKGFFESLYFKIISTENTNEKLTLILEPYAQ